MTATSSPSSAPLGQRSPLVEVWSLAWPTVIAMTSHTVMQFTDKLMVGQVGPTELAAQTSGGIWSFSLVAFALGILTVVNTFVSQNLGAGTSRNGPKYAWAAVWLACAIFLVVMLPYALALPWVFAHVLPAISHEAAPRSAELIAMETMYAQVLVFGSIFLMVGRGINQFFFGMHRPRVVTLAAIVGNIVNIFGNYVLIFGENGIPGWGIPGVPGMPALGLFGAAIATVFGSFVEFLIPAAIFLGPKLNRELATRAAWRPQWKPVKDLLRIGWPAAIQWGNELICWAIFMTVLVGGFGDMHLAACAIAFGYMSLSFMPAVGFSVAVNSIVGKYIGAGQPDIAVARTRLAVAVAMTYMTTCAVIFFVFRRELVGIFIDPANPHAQQIIEIGAKIMICSALFQTVDAIGVIYSGALRGAGDTVWPGVVTMIYSWVFIIGGGYGIVYFFPEIESLGPWIAAGVYIILYGFTMGLRFRSGRWRSIKLLDHGPEPGAARSVEVAEAGLALDATVPGSAPEVVAIPQRNPNSS